MEAPKYHSPLILKWAEKLHAPSGWEGGGFYDLLEEFEEEVISANRTALPGAEARSEEERVDTETLEDLVEECYVADELPGPTPTDSKRDGQEQPLSGLPQGVPIC